MNFTVTTNGWIFVSLQGYAIVRDGSVAPVYWKAYRPGSDGKPCIDPAHELAGGAGDQGWLKCVEYCRRHLEQGPPAIYNKAPEREVGNWSDTLARLPTEAYVDHSAANHRCGDPTCAALAKKSTPAAAPSSNDNPSPQQSSLL